MADAQHASQAREILDLVSRSLAPVLVLQARSHVITAASPGAHELLDEIAQPLVGRSLDELIEGPASAAMPLLATGQITGYETVHVLRLTGQRRRMWIRALPDTGAVPVVIAVLLRDDAAGPAFVPEQDDGATSPIIGSTDRGLMIDRISAEVHESLGYSVEDIIGASFLAWFVPEDIPEVLAALATIASQREGLTLRVSVVGADLIPVACRLVLLPLAPAPSCAFALLSEDSNGVADGRTVADLLARLSHAIRDAGTSAALGSATLSSVVELGRLSSRELEVVSRLMAGDRVSSIAKRLFLSEGTVRNYLSSVFGKFGVATQQQLIELLRPAPPAKADR
jgi:DNA-binding CsgD family transcriptional regulator